MNEPKRTRSEAIEVIVGFVLIFGALAWWKPPAAIAFAGSLFLVSGLWGRRIF